MHEMSLCEGILQIIEDHAQTQQFSSVKTVWLEIGALSGIEIEAMRFGFEAVTRNTIANGARLEIIEIPGTAWCMQCEKQVRVARRFDGCSICGDYELQVTGGDEMRIKELEVE